MRKNFGVLGLVFALAACEERRPIVTYQMVDELIASDPSTWTGHEMKVHGWVKPGSIIEKIIGSEVQRSFVLQKGTKRIRVFSHGPAPDTFKDQAEIVASGQIVPAAQLATLASRLGVTIEPEVGYVVDASDLMTKCPSKYDGVQGTRKVDTKFE